MSDVQKEECNVITLPMSSNNRQQLHSFALESKVSGDILRHISIWFIQAVQHVTITCLMYRVTGARPRGVQKVQTHRTSHFLIGFCLALLDRLLVFVHLWGRYLSKFQNIMICTGSRNYSDSPTCSLRQGQSVPPDGIGKSAIKSNLSSSIHTKPLPYAQIASQKNANTSKST